MTREELLKEIMEDPGNTLFGVPLSDMQRILYEYETFGINPERVWSRIRLLEQRRSGDGD